MKKINELYLKTVFCCMACDGNIADEELKLLKKEIQTNELFENMDNLCKLISSYVDCLKTDGVKFLMTYIEELRKADLSEAEELEVLRLAVDTIEVDSHIEYSEVKFFKRIRSQMTISDETILKKLPGKEEWLLPDIQNDLSFLKCYDFKDLKINLDLNKGSHDISKSVN